MYASVCWRPEVITIEPRTVYMRSVDIEVGFILILFLLSNMCIAYMLNKLNGVVVLYLTDWSP